MAKGSKTLKAPSAANSLVNTVKSIFGGVGSKAGRNAASGLMNMHKPKRSNGPKRLKAK